MNFDNTDSTHEEELDLKNVRFEHKQVKVEIEGYSFIVDEGLEEIMYTLNICGMATRNSCIDNFGKVWINFWTYSGFKEFFNLSFNHDPLWTFFQENMEITLHSNINMKIAPTKHAITEVMEILRDKLVEIKKNEGYDEKALEQINEDDISEYWRSPLSIRFPKEFFNEFRMLFFEASTKRLIKILIHCANTDNPQEN